MKVATKPELVNLLKEVNDNSYYLQVIEDGEFTNLDWFGLKGRISLAVGLPKPLPWEKT